MKILVIRFSSIGDIVLASPVFRCLKRQLEGVEIHFLTKHSFKAVTEANPYIDKFHYYDDNLKELLFILKKEKFDHVVDLHNNIRSRMVRKKLGRKCHVIDKLTFQKFLLTRLSINFMPGRHITQRSIDTVNSIGVRDDGGGLDYFIPDSIKVTAKDIPTAHHAGFLCLVIGANYYTKKLPVYKLQEFCRKIQHPVILIGGKLEEEEGAEIASVDPVKIYNACGKFSLHESADLVRQSKLVISHDTGFQYIACAFRKPVLAIWGGTSPKLDVESYYGTENETLHENIFLNLRCQPCSKYGLAKCPLEHFNCMEKQDIDFMVSKVHSLLGK